jgi:uncharacterized Zn-binding protein involved in type VI secretion
VRNAARLNDLTSHGTPLSPGPGSGDVFIESLPAWRGLPGLLASAFLAIQREADTAMRVAEAATTAAAGTPAAASAANAEHALKLALAKHMGAVVDAHAGPADVHCCPKPVPHPPHGNGIVIDGSTTVFINSRRACRIGDRVLEAVGGGNPISNGAKTVFIGDPGYSQALKLPRISAAADAIESTVTDFAEQARTLVEAAILGVPFTEPCAPAQEPSQTEDKA